MVIAEIELKHESQELILPRWIGKEVPGDPFFKWLDAVMGPAPAREVEAVVPDKLNEGFD